MSSSTSNTLPVPTRPDDEAINHTQRYLELSLNTLNASIFSRAPAFPLGSLRAELESKIEHCKTLKRSSVDEMPDITIHPDLAARVPPARVTVDNPDGVIEMIDTILTGHERAPETLDLYLDTEGDALGHGLSLLQLFVTSANTVYVLDVLSLEESAFTTPGHDGQTFKDILESSTIRKSIFAAAGDSSVLYKAHGICISNVTDLGLMAIACSSRKDKDMSIGLATCVQKCRKACLLSEKEAAEFKERKEWAHGVKSTKKPGVFDEADARIAELREAGQLEASGYVPLFNERPIPQAVYDYACWDVIVMPIVHGVLLDGMSKLEHPFSKLDDPRLERSDAEKFAMLKAKRANLGDKTWSELVEQKTEEILQLSQTEGYDPQKAWERGGKGVKDWAGLAF